MYAHAIVIAAAAAVATAAADFVVAILSTVKTYACMCSLVSRVQPIAHKFSSMM